MSSNAGSPQRGHGRTWTILGLVLLLVVGIVVYLRVSGQTSPITEQCTATADGEQVVLSNQQMANAATVTAVGMKGLPSSGLREGLPHQAIVVALSTALQESKLNNLSGGDRDSVGLFQQRPSQGWGTADQIMDPSYASEKFYAALARVPGGVSAGESGKPTVGQAAQSVQRSADGSDGASYEQHVPQATTLEAALSGAAPAGLTCQFVTQTLSTQAPGSDGFTARTDAVWSAMSDQFGFVVTRTAVTGASSTSGQPSALDNGRAFTLHYPTSDGDEIQRGWAVASWAVAHAASLGITQVSYDGRTWTASDSTAGWRTVAAPSPGGTTTSTNDVVVVTG